MSHILIITEKPSQSRKIADALSEKKTKSKKTGQATAIEIERDGKQIFIAPAVGHLFTLEEKTKTKTYPTYDIEWIAMHKKNKAAKYTKDYINNIKALCKDATEIYIATDLDIEGETIGYNILRYICKKEDAKRMEFSTLTKESIIKSFENAKPHINKGRADAGVTRHILDFYFGINISRALMSAVKTAGSFKTLSSGRVQGPALALLSERELEIKAFKSEPFWQIRAIADSFEAMYETEKIEDEKLAKKITEDCKGKSATVKEVERKEFKNNPPSPFNLTDLQIEAFKVFKYDPKRTQSIAQKLYEQAVMSYPRTSSQKLPKDIDLKAILKNLAKNVHYKNSAEKILKTKVKPNNGKKDDEAHPAIHPTGELPKTLSPEETKIYDLVVKRFLATFGEPAIRETQTAILKIDKHNFIAKGSRTIEENWFEFYKPFVMIKEDILPKLEKGENIKIKSIELDSKETQPPSRYNRVSVIKALEKKDLGTKATRAEIVENLYRRGYLEEKRIEVTELGLTVIETLKKYCPRIISDKLTRHFEKEMEDIRKGSKKPDKVTGEAEEELNNIFDIYKKNEMDIGKNLLQSIRNSDTKNSTFGKCPTCKDGNIVMKKGKFGRFLACDKYPDCKTTFKVPQKGTIKPTDKVCEKCSSPIIIIRRPKGKPQELCINPSCKSKEGNGDDKDNNTDIPEDRGECPKCKKGKLVLRSSIYGKFYGCTNYPKCRYSEKLNSQTK